MINFDPSRLVLSRGDVEGAAERLAELDAKHRDEAERADPAPALRWTTERDRHGVVFSKRAVVQELDSSSPSIGTVALVRDNPDDPGLVAVVFSRYVAPFERVELGAVRDVASSCSLVFTSAEARSLARALDDDAAELANSATGDFDIHTLKALYLDDIDRARALLRRARGRWRRIVDADPDEPSNAGGNLAGAISAVTRCAMSSRDLEPRPYIVEAPPAWTLDADADADIDDRLDLDTENT
jgi:hypothetical protein